MRLDETQRETISTGQSNNGSASVKQNKVIIIKNKNNMYKHFDEPLYDYIIIRETGKFSTEGYKTAYLLGVNYEDESKKIYCGYIDCFKVSPSCQFDFHKDGGISVFCKDFSQPNCVSKVFATNSYTGKIIAIKDCDKSFITSED